MNDVLALSTAEQFALWSLRHRRAFPWDGDILAEGFFRAFGVVEVEEALAAFAAFCDPIGRHGRRRLSLNGCRCRALAADERCLLILLGAAQGGALRHSQALADWLCRPAGQEALVDSAGRLARSFRSRGLLLPQPIGNNPCGGYASRPLRLACR